MLKRFSKDTRGATAIEYGLVAAFIAVVLVGALSMFSPKHAKQPVSYAVSPATVNGSADTVPSNGRLPESAKPR